MKLPHSQPTERTHIFAPPTRPPVGGVLAPPAKDFGPFRGLPSFSMELAHFRSKERTHPPPLNPPPLPGGVSASGDVLRSSPPRVGVEVPILPTLPTLPWEPTEGLCLGSCVKISWSTCVLMGKWQSPFYGLTCGFAVI